MDGQIADLGQDGRAARRRGIPEEMLTEVLRVLEEHAEPLAAERILRELRGTLLYRESLVFADLVEGLYRLL